MLYAIMPVKNEAQRYLHASLNWLTGIVDTVFVWDDRSDDDSVDIAQSYKKVVVATNPPNAPSFLDHEGWFRNNGWRVFEQTIGPTTGDWILAIDADEFLVSSKDADVSTVVLRSVASAVEQGHASCLVAVREVFGLDDWGYPLIRVDGFWPDNVHPRLVRYQPNGKFRDTPLACGSVPTYATSGAYVSSMNWLNILHYGYASEADRKAKYERYVNRSGHNQQHVASILTPPHLIPWGGQIPLRVL